MPGVTASIALTVAARLTGADAAGTVPVYDFRDSLLLSLEPGTDAVNKADLLYRATRTLAASANEDLDLAGVLASPLGVTIAAAEVVAIVIEADAANGGNVSFGPAAVNGALGPFGDASDRLSLAPGDFYVLTNRNGWAIAAGTADLLNFANADAGAAADYTITVVGRTVAA